tara:strand:- start:737 stop:1075 length:339 start_codon:yes stop_codon:yes gene_type:complete
MVSLGGAGASFVGGLRDFETWKGGGHCRPVRRHPFFAYCKSDEKPLETVQPVPVSGDRFAFVRSTEHGVQRADCDPVECVFDDLVQEEDYTREDPFDRVQSVSVAVGASDVS